MQIDQDGCGKIQENEFVNFVRRYAELWLIIIQMNDEVYDGEYAA